MKTFLSLAAVLFFSMSASPVFAAASAKPNPYATDLKKIEKAQEKVDNFKGGKDAKKDKEKKEKMQEKVDRMQERLEKKKNAEIARLDKQIATAESALARAAKPSDKKELEKRISYLNWMKECHEAWFLGEEPPTQNASSDGNAPAEKEDAEAGADPTDAELADAAEDDGETKKSTKGKGKKNAKDKKSTSKNKKSKNKDSGKDKKNADGEE